MMIEEIKTRLKELHDRRADVLEKIAGVFESGEYIQGDSVDRARLEDRAGIVDLKMQLWEISRRERLLIESAMIPDSESEIRGSLIEYFEKCDDEIMGKMEKGLSDKPSRKEIAEFVALGFCCNECQEMIATLKICETP